MGSGERNFNCDWLHPGSNHTLLAVASCGSANHLPNTLPPPPILINGSFFLLFLLFVLQGAQIRVFSSHPSILYFTNVSQIFLIEHFLLTFSAYTEILVDFLCCSHQDSTRRLRICSQKPYAPWVPLVSWVVAGKNGRPRLRPFHLNWPEPVSFGRPERPTYRKRSKIQSFRDLHGLAFSFRQS